MPFARSGDTLTFTGSARSFSAIEGVSTHFFAGGGGLWVLADDIFTLRIEGDLRINQPETQLMEGLLLLNITRLEVASGATFQVGAEGYSFDGDCLIIPRLRSGNNTTGCSFFSEDGSTVRFFGGVIKTASSFFFGSSTQGSLTETASLTAEFRGTKIINIAGTGIDAPRVFVNPALPATSVRFVDCTFDGVTHPTTLFSSRGYNELSATLKNATIATDGNAERDIVEIRDLSTSANRAPYDLESRGPNQTMTNKLVLINSEEGSAVTMQRKTTSAGLVMDFERELKFRVFDTSGTPVEGALIFCKLKTGSRAGLPGSRYATGYDQLVTPTWTTGADGSTPVQSIRYAFAIDEAGTAPALVTPESVTDQPDDAQTFSIRSYGHVSQDVTLSLRGAGEMVTDIYLLPDDNITLTREQAADLTGILVEKHPGGDYMNPPAITITREGVLRDEIYCAAKLWHTSGVWNDISVKVAGNRIVLGDYGGRSTDEFMLILSGDGSISTEGTLAGFAPGTVLDFSGPEEHHGHDHHAGHDLTGLVAIDPPETFRDMTADLTTLSTVVLIRSPGTYDFSGWEVTPGAGKILFVILPAVVTIKTTIPAESRVNGNADPTNAASWSYWDSLTSATFLNSSATIAISGFLATETVDIFTDAAQTQRPAEYPSPLSGREEYEITGVAYAGEVLDLYIFATDADGVRRGKKFDATVDQSYSFAMNSSLGSVKASVDNVGRAVDNIDGRLTTSLQII